MNLEQITTQQKTALENLCIYHILKPLDVGFPCLDPCNGFRGCNNYISNKEYMKYIIKNTNGAGWGKH